MRTFHDGKVTLHAGDCLDVLKAMPENSIDAVVTDPPYMLNFMGRAWDRATCSVPIDPGFAHWFAGFSDGEACFSVHKKNVNGCETYDCQFAITLRADDKPILIEIQKHLGGIGYLADRPKGERGEAQARYCISSKKDCQRLQVVFQAFPLRAKKAKDFEIWSQALDAWVAHEPGTSWEDVAYFRDALMAVRKFGSVYRPEQLFFYQWAREVLRVLKPGGHMVCFGGTRTYHRMVCAIEDAGFEVRDQLAWVYGSGFPKSHDVSKGIEKRRVEDEEPVRVICRAIRAAMDSRGLKSRDLTAHFGNCHARLIDHWAARDTDSQPSLPTPSQWATLRELLPLAPALDAEVARLNERKGEFGEAYGERAVTGTHDEWTDRTNYAITGRDNLRRDIPATDAARQWQGWGTALKPAFEPVCLARKPLSESTVAANVLRWGTGALNIDGCRIGIDEQERSVIDTRSGAGFGTIQCEHAGREEGEKFKSHGLGRWPANLCHDGSPEVLEGFPETTSGQQQTSKPMQRQDNEVYGKGLGSIGPENTYSDSGSAARFFYTAKADSDDRLGSKHPTVKPVDLMQWLVRLVCPKGATVLDPFAGTGTTGAASFIEGRQAVLIEREAEYLADIERRMELLLSGPDERARKLAQAEPHETLPLFA